MSLTILEAPLQSEIKPELALWREREPTTLLEKATRLARKVGHTPIRKIRYNGRIIYLKEEGQNPAGSIKDRPAMKMVYSAISEGKITPETVVAESTSGNTGIGVAWVCAELGLTYHNYSPNTLSQMKQDILRGYDAELFFAEGGTDEATKMLSVVMEKEPERYFWTSQFTNENNWQAHVICTAPEVLRQVPNVDEVWVAFGSGGTSTGFAYALKNTDVDLRVVQNTRDRDQRVEGMRNLAWISKPPIADVDAIGETNMFDTDPDTYLAIARQIYAGNEGFVIGTTTAAILTQAVKSDAPTIVVVSPDNGDRYPEWENKVVH